MTTTVAAPEKVKNLFGDLGKPTMRGVRKCPKCGTFNGTRGVSCKNKLCDAVFKERERKRGHSADAVKIITGSTVQVFSVRLRDRGPDYRGFVQLPLVQDLDGNPATVVDTSVLAGAARCYVDNCLKTVSATSNADVNTCTHIKSAIDCVQEAQPLTLKNSVLNTLQVNNETKQAIWLLATETTGPLVQRVTKNIMVVKCKPTSKQPMGFLHFSFYEVNKNRSDHREYRFQCSCKAFRSYKHGVIKDDNLKRCVHFYACICAFASDEKLTEEFAYYINLDNNVPLDIINDSQVLTIYPSSEVSVSTTDSNTLEVMVMDEDILGSGDCQIKKRKRDDSVVQGYTIQEVDATYNKKSSPNKVHSAKSTTTPKKSLTTPIDESQVSVAYLQWLSSVTERINQTMHYQFDGNPEPLVFHAPQAFFECLQQRISAGNKKRRLPNFTTGFVRKDALPLGTFTKYTWHITNILHVKQIFDTPDIPLDITRSFIGNRDGSYELYEAPRLDVESIDESLKPNKNQTPIRPFERKTFLRVGTSTTDSKEPTPFIIEWIPDILPQSRIGELRIKFEYGHQRNGHVEQRIQVPFQDIPLQTIQTIHVQEL